MDEIQINPEELYTEEGANPSPPPDPVEGPDEHVEAVAFENAEAGASPSLDGEAVKNPVLEISGFRFLNTTDAEKAQVDVNKIAYIDAHASYSSAAAMRAIYEKAIENRIFSTPVGWTFLKQIRDRLLKTGVPEDELPSIPMSVSFTHEPMAMTSVVAKERAEEEMRRAAANKRGPGFVVSIAMNIILAVLVVVIFYVASISDSDNILNYKRNVTNRYSTWEQELREREQNLRKKEREMGIKVESSASFDTSEENEGEDTDE